MYTAGGAGRNISTAYKDFWYLFWDTCPPASPYPSKRGDSRWRSVCRHIMEYRQIWNHGTSKNTKDTNWVDCVDASGTAAASPIDRGTTGVAGYVYRWRSQHK